MVKNVKIKKHTRQNIRLFQSRYESVDEVVNRLLDVYESELSDDTIYPAGHTTIDLEESTMNRIKSCSVYEGEPYDSILSRLIMLAKR